MESVVYNINYEEGMRISLVKGNTKLGKGVYSFNTLPGDQPLTTKTRGQLTNLFGTCSGCCDGCESVCYAVRDAKLHHNSVIPSAGKNTVILRFSEDIMFSQLKEELIAQKAKVLRWHSSGEVPTYSYLLHMVKLAVEMPEMKFYFYTKRFDFIEKYLKECGAFPDNLICNISEWKDNTKGYDLRGVNKFIYDDGTDESLKKVVHCPAVNKEGKATGVNCDQCKRCFTKNDGRITAVYSH